MLQTQATHALKPQGQFYDLPQVKSREACFKNMTIPWCTKLLQRICARGHNSMKQDLARRR